MSKRVVITGFGGLTACSDTITGTWDTIKRGETGIAPITQWDVSECAYPLGGEIKNYQPRNLLVDRKLHKVLSRQDIIGLNAVHQTLEHSQLLPYRDQLPDATEFNNRTGVYVASPGNKFNQQYDFLPLFAKAGMNMQQFAEELFATVHPMWLLRILPNNVLAYTGIQYGFKGANQNITNHAVGGIQAINEAYAAIVQGQIDRAIIVGYDAAIEPQAVMYYSNLGLLSKTSIKPFDKHHDGTILAEGAGALILESESAATARKAQIYGEILGGATTSEAKGIFSLDESAIGLKRALTQAMQQARLTAQDIGMVTTHGNGNVRSDITEAQALAEQFNATQTPMTAFKWALGHTVAASGVLETLLTLFALREKTVPGVATFSQCAEGCQGINITADIQQPHSAVGLTISRAFGGLNACLLLTADYANY